MRPVAPLLLALAACSASTTTNVDDKPRTATLAEYVDADIGFGCAGYACVFGIAPVEAPAFCGDEPEKRADLAKAVKAGRIVFDGAKAPACIDALKGFDPRSCWGPAPSTLDAAIARGEAACARVLVGTVAEGGTCWLDAECAAGFCDSTKDKCPGQCAARYGAQATCTRTEECGAGLVCNAKKCVAPASAGGACSGLSQCAAGLLCVASKCAEPLLKDASCDPAHDGCGAGLWCAPSTSKCAEKVPAGGKCRVGADGLTVGSAACAGGMVCTGIVFDDDGQVLVEGTCAAPQEVGGLCVPTGGNPNANDSGCYLGLTCDATNSSCARFPNSGEACLDGQCRQDAWCDGNTCRPRKADGVACEKTDECVNACLTTKVCGSASGARGCHPA
jgi:hypothetical protein